MSGPYDLSWSQSLLIMLAAWVLLALVLFGVWLYERRKK